MTSIKFAAAAVLASVMLAGCGAKLAPTAGLVSAAALTAQSAKKPATATKGTKGAKRPALPVVKKAATPTRQGIAASQAAQDCDYALGNYQSLSDQWAASWDDNTKDALETQMLNVLHQALNDTQSVTSAQGVDTADRRSYDVADQALNRYDAAYTRWSATWDVNTKRVIINQMLSDMVGTLQQIRANY